MTVGTVTGPWDFSKSRNRLSDNAHVCQVLPWPPCSAPPSTNSRKYDNPTSNLHGGMVRCLPTGLTGWNGVKSILDTSRSTRLQREEKRLMALKPMLLGLAMASAASHSPGRRGAADSRLFADRLGIGLASGGNHRLQVGSRQARHQPEVLRRPAEAGKPDQGDPLVHRAEGRRDRLRAGGRIGLGHGAEGSQGREDSGDPDSIATSIPADKSLYRDPHRLRLRRGRPKRRPTGWSKTRRASKARATSSSCRARSAPAPAIDRKKGFEEIIKADPNSRSSARRPATSPAPRARK